MKRLDNGTENFILVTVFALVAGVMVADAQTRQTITAARADHNEAVCLAAKLTVGCTQAEVDAAVSVPKGTIYTTDPAYRDGVLLPEMLDRRTEAKNNRIYEAVSRAFQSLTPAERVAVCTAFPRAKLADPEVCR